MFVVEGEPARLEVDIDQQQPGLDPGHDQGDLAERHQPVTGPGFDHRIPHRHRIGGGDPDLVAEPAGVSGARHGDPAIGDLGRGQVEELEVGHLGGETSQHGARSRPLDRKDPPILGYVFDLDRLVADQPAQIGEVGPGGGEHELVGRQPQHHPVLDDEPAVVAPHRVLRLPGTAPPDVPCQHPGQVVLGAGPDDAVLVEGRRVEDAHGVANGEVFELLRHVVFLGDEVAGPMAPQPGGVGRLDPGMERCGAVQMALPYGAPPQ